MPALPKHKREADRLVQVIALCTISDDVSFAATEREIRANVKRNARLRGLTELDVLRGMFDDIKRGRPHQTTNLLAARSLADFQDDEDFEHHKDVFREMQWRANHVQEIRSEFERSGTVGIHTKHLAKDCYVY